jgi:sugar phosphate isomerase/epimerase
MNMTVFSRRQFLAAGATSAAALSHGKTLRTLGVQLYTVRGLLPEKPAETLQALADIGYREAEVVGATLAQIWPSLKQTPLKPVSVHLETALFTRDQGKLPAALDDAKQRGLEYAVCPYIAPADRGGIEVIRKLGETLNRAGEICRKAGMKLCYHNHAFEFEPAAGGTLLDELLRVTDPKLVGLELDIMWAQVAGVPPVAVLQKYGKRIWLMHLKNVAAGIPKQYNEKVERSAFREVGNGVIDVAAVLKAADKAGVKHYFVEQDQTPGDPVASLRQSFEYVSKLQF